MKDKILCSVKYKAGVTVREEFLPKTLKFVGNGETVLEIEVKEFGVIERAGRKLAFAVCKIVTELG